MKKKCRILRVVCCGFFVVSACPTQLLATGPKVIDFQAYRQGLPSKHAKDFTPSDVMEMVSAIVFGDSEPHQQELLATFLGRFIASITEGDTIPASTERDTALIAIKGLQLIVQNESDQNPILKDTAASAIQNLIQYINTRLDVDPDLEVAEIEFFAEATSELLDSLTEQQLRDSQRRFTMRRDLLISAKQLKKIDTNGTYLLKVYEKFLGRANFSLCQRKLTMMGSRF